MLDRRGAILAALTGVLPVLGLAQDSSTHNSGIFVPDSDEMFVSFVDPDGKSVDIGWRKKDHSLLVRYEGEELAVPIKEIMKALRDGPVIASSMPAGGVLSDEK